MRYAFAALVAAAAFALTLGASSSAEAQVIISGQVTSYTEPTPTATAPASTYVAGEPTPTRYVHHSANIPALYVPGLILLIGGYAANVFGLAWYAADQLATYRAPGEDWYLYGLVPIVGPFLQFGADPGAQAEGVSIITGIAQVGGLIMTILGFALTDEWDEPVYVFNEADPMSPRLSFELATAPGGGAIATGTLTHF
jgi:hypothetical protein